MKKILMTILTVVSGMILLDAKNTLPDWQDPGIVEENRVPMSSHFETDGLKMTLNGTWKFCWYESIDSRSKEFYTTSFDDAEWDDIPVPGMWELNGYGDPLYKNVGYAWYGHYENNPPFPAMEHNYAGQYRRTFTIDEEWDGKDIFLHIGSATSNVRVEDQYHYGYCRPQESGTKTQIKWMKVLDDNGTGFEITSDVRFSASALPFSSEEMDFRANNNEQAHSLELKKLAFENVRSLGKTWVAFDLAQTGLGCVNSWRAWPRPEYQVKAQPYQFRFVIRPVNN